MTNKANGPCGQIKLKTTTITSHHAYRNVLNNGYRPHGGYRGTKGHPPSPYSFDKPDEFHEQIRDEVKQSVESENIQITPAYALKASKESTNSGESPLFVHHLLAPSRLEQQFSVEEYYAQGLHLKSSRPNSARPPTGRQLYYRPPGKHGYLSATSRSESGSDMSLDSLSKYGRPTRTTLLRARHRCNSAPISSALSRKEIQKKSEESHNRRSTTTEAFTVSDFSSPMSNSKESLYSFLIGARYNRAHCLDAQSAENFGVYMPRNNPLGCFIVKDKFMQDGASDGVPSTPPDSPMSQSDAEDMEEEESPPRVHKAWESHRQASTRPHSAANRRSLPLMQQIINLEDGLNVKGRSMDQRTNSSRKLVRPHSALPPSVPRKSRSARPASAPKSGSSSREGPFVWIQGRSMGAKSDRRVSRSSIDRLSQPKQPKVMIPSAPTGPPPPSPRGNSARLLRSNSQVSQDLTVSQELTLSHDSLTVPSHHNRPKSAKRHGVRSAMPTETTSIKNNVDNTQKVEEDIEDVFGPDLAFEESKKDISEFDRVMETIKAVQQEEVENEFPPEVASEILSESEDCSKIESASQKGKRTSRVRFAEEVTIEGAMDSMSLQDGETEKSNTEARNESETAKHGDYLSVAFFLTEEGKDKDQNGEQSIETPSTGATLHDNDEA